MKATRTTSNKNKTLVSISVLSPKNKRKYVTDNKRANKKVYVARTNNESSLKKIVPEQVVPRIWIPTIGVQKKRTWKVTLILPKK